MTTPVAVLGVLAAALAVALTGLAGLAVAARAVRQRRDPGTAGDWAALFGGTVAAAPEPAVAAGTHERVPHPAGTARYPLPDLLGAGELPPGRAARDRALADLAIARLADLRGTDRARLIAALERAGALQRAQSALRSLWPGRRVRAATLLGLAGTADHSTDLARALRDRYPRVRQAAAQALGRLADPRVVPDLLARVGGSRPVPAGVVRGAILHIGVAGLAPLRAALAAPDPTTRVVAAQLLGVLGDRPSTGALIAAMAAAPVPAHAATIARALGRLGSPAACSALVDGLAAGPAGGLAAAAAWALGRVGDPGAVAPLVAATVDADSTTILACVEALAELGGPGARALTALAGGGTPAARYAREALATARPRTAGRPG